MFRFLLLLCLAAPPALAQTADDIMRAQEELVALGYDLTADGQESLAMTAAIKAYQRDWELPEDGILDDDLYARLTRSHPDTAPREQKAEGRDDCSFHNGRPMARETITHAGACTAGVPEGQGKTVWRFYRTGEWLEETWTGTFRTGKLHGKGELRWANGNVYIGDFVDGARTGKGEFRWADGDVYIGDFVDGARTGQGEYRWADGNVYTGDFVDGVRTGKGEFRWANGDVYIGDFVDDAQSGQGEYRWADGDVYIGGYMNDRPQGHGVAWTANGKLEGQWNDGCLLTENGWSAIGRDADTCG